MSLGTMTSLCLKGVGIVVVAALFLAVAPSLQREVRTKTETQEGYRTGLFPACLKKIQRYHSGDGESMGKAVAVASSIKRSGDKITG